jgi:hypothetical protein
MFQQVMLKPVHKNIDMETFDFKLILKALKKYYPLGLPETEGGYDDIREIISKKLSGEHPIMEKWVKFIDELKAMNPHFVDDCYYFQYPDLMVIIENKVTVEGITVNRRFIICISLLCPIYTYFYEYSHSVKRQTSGALILGGTYFLKDENYENFKINVDLEVIDKLIIKYFPEYSFAYHVSLMYKEITGGFPIGESHGLDKKYNLYQYLFNSIYHKNNIDI